MNIDEACEKVLSYMEKNEIELDDFLKWYNEQNRIIQFYERLRNRKPCIELP